MTIQYQGVWSLTSAAQLQSTQRWVTDPLYKNTTLLLQADDAANGSQNNTFLDSSSNSFAITRNGNTTQGSFTPFSQSPGRWGNFFDGADDFLQRTSPATGLINWTSTNWTLEYWIYANAFGQGANTESNIIGNATDGGATAYWSFGPISTGAVRWYYFTGASPTITTTTTLATGRWYHLAFVNNGGNLAIYIDGVSSATGTIIGTPQFSSGTPFTIGKITGSSFNGYISNLRITQSAVYTANFTPSSIPLSPISGTQLMTCQSNQFIDNSTSPVVFTPSGTPSVQPFSPFAPQFQWTPSVIGGSGYFDGNGDFLQTATTTSFAFGTGNFTIEGWVYLTAYNSGACLFGTTQGATTGYYVNLGGDVNSLRVTSNASGVWTDNITVSAGNGIRLNEWTHIALVRNAGSLILYKNGANVASTSGAAAWNFTSPNNAGYIGRVTNGTSTQDLAGWVTSVRVSNTARTITVPTAPYSSDANTVLLTNFTNAGIYDGTMKNNLETVGNAQVSTAVVKYGSGSMFFDGNGDNLAAPVNNDLNFGTGDFTVECWVNITTRTLNYPLIAGNNNGGFSAGAIALTNSNFDNAAYYDRFVLSVFDIAGSGSAPALVAGVPNALNTWYHLAIVRNNTSLVMYRDGVAVASRTISAAIVFNWGKLGLRVGGGNWDGANSWFNGYLDDMRFTRGIARYTQNFIPPSVALPRQ